MFDTIAQAISDANEASHDIDQMYAGTKSTKPKLEFFKEGDGRYQVIYGGLRLGLVLGGMGHWIAEAPNKHQVSCKTRKEAAAFLLSLHETQRAQARW